jgi:tetratricopeptide (TPR) repeat protein
VKDRVLTTFQQTVALYKQGRTDEVGAGCNLILQMDPAFDPARKLIEKMRNPAAPIDVDALLPVARDPRDPMQQAREAMAARDFSRVVQLTTEVLTDDLLNDDARVLGDEARERLEAAPFVEQFARKAEHALAGGNAAAAKMELEKARSLDATHPEVLRVAAAIDARNAAPAVAAPPPAFVVDSPAPGARSTAQAADFGFTFEEEKKPEVSFNDFSFNTPSASDFSFDASTPAPMGGSASTFDFATASVATTDDDQKKIEQYLTDGDRAYDAGDYSQAIDLWSRIFLIDVTNDQASERIERAKGKRRDLEQKAESVLAAGIEAFTRGDTAMAHTHLNEVLRLDPRNTQAQEYLDRLGETLPATAPRSPAARADEKLDIFEDDFASDGSLTPPDREDGETAFPAAAKPKKAVPAARPAAERKLPVGLIAAVLAGILVLGGGWFVWSKFFSASDAQEETGAGAGIIGRASMLAGKGEYDKAIALLRDIKPGDPSHEKALVMIADLQQKKSGAAQLIDGVPAAQYYEQRLAAATAAFNAGDYSAAKTAYEQALRVQPLTPDHKTRYDAASQQASKLDAARALFAERKYAEAIANLEPLLQQDPQNVSIRRMLGDAHFNQAAMALQEERTPDAIRELDETLKLNPADELARRSRELAQRYNNEPKDLLYKIYVKYLPLRAG